MEYPYAEIKLDLFKAGIHLVCEDADIDVFIEKGDGDKLVGTINEIEEICDPDVKYSLTDKGRELLKQLRETGSCDELSEEQIEVLKCFEQ